MKKEFVVLSPPTESSIGLPPEKRTWEQYFERAAVILDKPRKTTSQNLVVHIKKMTNAKKAAHVGTLDPNVTGVLPILFNKSVKINHFLSKFPKEYVVLMTLHSEVEEDKIIEAIKSFEGEITQTPPKKSAVKKKPRKRKIFSLDVLEIDSNRYVLFKAYVEAGTYIRTLCIDIGKKLGVKAHMQELRRTKSLGFDEDVAVSFYDFHEKAVLCTRFGKCSYLKELLMPIEDIVRSNFKQIFVSDVAASALTYGANLYRKGIVMYEKSFIQGDIVGVFSLSGELIGLGKVINPLDSGDVVVDMLSVLSSTSHYPKLWKH